MKEDPKGLYRKARKGEINDFTGISSRYETPRKPEIHVINNNVNLDKISDEIITISKKITIYVKK